MDSLVYMSKPQIHLFKHYRNPKILKQGKKKKLKMIPEYHKIKKSENKNLTKKSY